MSTSAPTTAAPGVQVHAHELVARTGKQRANGREYTMTYDVHTLGTLREVAELLNAANVSQTICPLGSPIGGSNPCAGAGLPLLWAYADGDPWTLVDEIDFTQDKDSLYHWFAHIHYAPYRPWDHLDPLSRWPRISFPFRSFREPIVQTTDASPKRIVNSAGYPFDPPLEEEYEYPCIDIVSWNTTYNPVTAATFKNSVNSAQIVVAGVTVAAGVGLMEEYSGGVQLYVGTYPNGTPANYYYVEQHIRIALTDRPWLWKRRVLDQGVYDILGRHIAIDDATNAITTTRPLPSTAHNVVTPWLLDGSGYPLAPGASGVYLPDMQTKKVKDWSTISPTLPATKFPTYP